MKSGDEWPDDLRTHLAEYCGGSLAHCDVLILEGSDKRGDSLRGAQLPHRHGCSLTDSDVLILEGGNERPDGLDVAQCAQSCSGSLAYYPFQILESGNKRGDSPYASS